MLLTESMQAHKQPLYPLLTSRSAVPIRHIRRQSFRYVCLL